MISPKKLLELASLFNLQPTFRAGIDAVLEGRCGSVVRGQQCARLDLGPFSMLGGDSTAPDARALAAEITFPRIFVASAPWHDLIREAHQDRDIELVQRTQFSPDAIDDIRVEALRKAPADVHISRLDAELLAAALDQLSPDLLIREVFETPEAFVSEGGFGFAATQEGRIVAAATSAIVSRRDIEVQINTAQKHQRRGLATAVGAAIVLESRARSLIPGWDTASPASERLARKLGFRVARYHEWLCLKEGAVSRALGSASDEQLS